MQTLRWSYVALPVIWCVATVLDCGGRGSTFEAHDDPQGSGGATKGTATGSVAVNGSGGATASGGSTAATSSSLDNGGAYSTHPIDGTAASAGNSALGTVTAATGQAGGSGGQGTTSLGGMNGQSGAGGMISLGGAGGMISLGGAGGMISLGGAGGRTCPAAAGWPGIYNGFPGGGGVGGATDDSCNGDPDCCAMCRQQALTAFYVDANCELVSCAYSDCVSYCWMYMLRGSGPTARARVQCRARGIWTCKASESGGYYPYYPVEPAGC